MLRGKYLLLIKYKTKNMQHHKQNQNNIALLKTLQYPPRVWRDDQ